mgnify:CR=1 FL=1
MWVLTRPVLDQLRPSLPRPRQPMPQALGRQGRGVEQVQHRIHDGRVPVGRHRRHGAPCPAVRRRGSRRVRARDAWSASARRRRSRCGTGCRSSTTCSRAIPIRPATTAICWSEVMDADTREAFAEAGNVFDKATAAKLRKYILAPGQHDRPGRGLPPVPRPRSRDPGAPQEARIPDDAVNEARHPKGGDDDRQDCRNRTDRRHRIAARRTGAGPG